MNIQNTVAAFQTFLDTDISVIRTHTLDCTLTWSCSSSVWCPLSFWSLQSWWKSSRRRSRRTTSAETQTRRSQRLGAKDHKWHQYMMMLSLVFVIWNCLYPGQSANIHNMENISQTRQYFIWCCHYFVEVEVPLLWKLLYIINSEIFWYLCKLHQQIKKLFIDGKTIS